MNIVLESITQAVSEAMTFIVTAFTGLSLNPLNWESRTWLVLVSSIVFLWLLTKLFTRKAKRSDRPELLVSKGIVQQPEESPTQVLRIKISNLNAYPVQLIEMALQSELMSSPFIVEAAEIIAPHSAVELEAVLPNNMVGDKGRVGIYVYLSKRRQKIYKLNTSFEWEPWAQRYKIEATGQRLQRAGQLASTRLNQARKKAWHQYNTKVPAPKVDMPEERPKQEEQIIMPRTSRALDMDFPAEF